MAYYKQQVEEGQKRMARLEARNAERPEPTAPTPPTHPPAPVWKPFTMKTIDATPDQYEGGDYKK